MTESCKSVSEILSRIGDMWSVLVVMTLKDGPRRFSEIRRAIPEVSQRVLTLTLRGLERDGPVSRKVTPSIPPRVDYDMTGVGRPLQTPVLGLGNWAIENRPQIDAARAAFFASAKQSPAR